MHAIEWMSMCLHGQSYGAKRPHPVGQGPVGRAGRLVELSVTETGGERCPLSGREDQYRGVWVLAVPHGYAPVV